MLNATFRDLDGDKIGFLTRLDVGWDPYEVPKDILPDFHEHAEKASPVENIQPLLSFGSSFQ